MYPSPTYVLFVIALSYYFRTKVLPYLFPNKVHVLYTYVYFRPYFRTSVRTSGTSVLPYVRTSVHKRGVLPEVLPEVLSYVRSYVPYEGTYCSSKVHLYSKYNVALCSNVRRYRSNFVRKCIYYNNLYCTVHYTCSLSDVLPEVRNTFEG